MSSQKTNTPVSPYKRFKYQDEDMENAIKAVKGGVSLNNAAATFNVPKSTLHSRVTGKIPEKGKMGPKSVLTDAEENFLKQWILGKAQVGFPMHPDEVKDAVQRILQTAPRENPFRDNRPGDKWLKLFIRRHPEISEKNTEIISKARTAVSEEALREWFGETRRFLQKKNSLDVLNSPGRIFYSDEVGVQVCMRSGTVLGPRNDKRVSEISNDEKEYITILCTFSAAGHVVPPMIVYPYKRIPMHIHILFPNEWTVGRSDTGLIIHSTLYDYIVKDFYPWCSKSNIVFPVLFFLNSRKYHINSELHEFCDNNKIILYSLPPNLMSMMRPFDTAVLKPLRNYWKKAVTDSKGQKSATKTNFAPLCKTAFDSLFTEEALIKNAFRECGLYPFDETAVDYGKCISSRLTPLEFIEPSITLHDFTAAKKVIELFIGPEQTELFVNLRNENSRENSVDSLFSCWKMCADRVEGLLPVSNVEGSIDNGESEVDPLQNTSVQDLGGYLSLSVD